MVFLPADIGFWFVFWGANSNMSAIDQPNYAKESPVLLKRRLDILNLIHCKFVHTKNGLYRSITNESVHIDNVSLFYLTRHDSPFGHLMY